MKAERLQTALWAYVLALCLGLGAVAAMATGLGLPVSLKALSLCCALIGLVLCPFLFMKHGIWLPLAAMAGVMFSHSLQLELKTLIFYLLRRLNLGYGFPIPEPFQGELAASVLWGLCFLAAVIMVLCIRTVVCAKSGCLPVVVSVLPLACCVTVIDTVPHSLWLIVWLFGLLLLIMTQTLRRHSHQQANRLSLGLLIPTAAAVLLLFVLIPRDAPQRWQVSQIPQQLLSHFTGVEAPGGVGLPLPNTLAQQNVDLTDLGPRNPPPTAVGQVTADFHGRLYLRARDYDTYSGDGWSASESRTEEVFGFSPQWHYKEGTVSLRIYQPKNYYLLPAYTQQAQILKGGIAENPSQERTYAFDYCRLQENWEQQWQEDTAFTVNPRYLALPDEALAHISTYFSTAGSELAQSLPGLSTSQKAQKIAQAVRSVAPYDLNTPNMPAGSTDLAYWFLTEAQSGYCVHYATATAVLLRWIGIPSRYVEGYAVTAQKGRPVTVQELHAHAWVEYYLENVGWVVLEATPGIAEDPEQPTEETTEPTTQPKPTEPTQVPTEEVSPPALDAGDPKPQAFKLPQWVKNGLWALLWGMLAAALLLGQYRLRRWRLKRRCSNPNPNQSALAIYRQLARVCRAGKEPVPDSVMALAQKARFSSHRLTAQELKTLAAALSAGETALKTKKLLPRLVAKWLLALY